MHQKYSKPFKNNSLLPGENMLNGNVLLIVLNENVAILRS